MSKHTPGPWLYTPSDEWRTNGGEFAQWGEFKISAGSGDVMAPNYYRVGSVSNVNNSDENEANARLIAAAPELLQALQAVSDAEAADEAGIDYELIGRVHAAIAKALGEQPCR